MGSEHRGGKVMPTVLGLTIALGVLLVVLGLRPAAPLPIALGSFILKRPRPLSPRSILMAVFVGIAIGWATGWPVAGIASGVGALTVPRMLRQPAVSHTIEIREALAEWAQRLANALAAG